ncbi:hypothetical protein IFM89_029382 [Coptis chinensis]|uniref:RNase H type-1 domain-containing protein n=1 Tax=Coptis chinensis TaxID=261450 RepID=A0A835ISA1_9MAGN|nr:hypothetical protein IFM89_029382 [Coptis chinensis]
MHIYKGQLAAKIVLQVGNLKIQSLPRLVMIKCSTLVTWKKPPVGFFKLNSDGSSLNNPGRCGGGGIIRDHNGVFCEAFAFSFGFGSNTKAELFAVLEGLKICLQRNFRLLIVELDSQIILGWFYGGKGPP